MMFRTLLLIWLAGSTLATSSPARPGRFYRRRRPVVIVPSPRRRRVVYTPAISSTQLAFRQLDTSGEGALDYNELLRLASTPGPTPRRSEDPLPLRLARVMDRNSDGAASGDEQAAAASAILAALDRDRDGRLNYYEYLELRGDLGWLRRAVRSAPRVAVSAPAVVAVAPVTSAVPISRYDLNRDGRVTLAERNAIRAADRAALGGPEATPAPSALDHGAQTAQLEALEAEAAAAEARAKAARARAAAARVGLGLQ